jgi:hypothetical protein
MLENTEGVMKRDNPEATLGAQEEDKRNKNTTQYVLEFLWIVIFHYPFGIL